MAERSDQGEVAAALGVAAATGADFTAAGVPDTPGNRDLFARIQAEIADLPAGVMPDIPPE
jgi:hypothetical protein